MTETEQAVITKWRDRANAAVRSLVALQERYDQVQAEAEALRPLRAALLRYGQALADVRDRQRRGIVGAASTEVYRGLQAAARALAALALALAAAEGQD